MDVRSASWTGVWRQPAGTECALREEKMGKGYARDGKAQGYRILGVNKTLFVVLVLWWWLRLGLWQREFAGTWYRTEDASVGGVCGLDGVNYDSEARALERGTTVLHADKCGACSNPHDVMSYRDSRMTLTKQTTFCATLFLVFGDTAALQCLERTSKFTKPCQKCWFDNIQCTTALCSGVCTRHILHSVLLGHGIGQAREDGTLNRCLDCDERNCGPAFKECAGANRRRCGIVTDIARRSDEVYSNKAAFAESGNNTM